MRRCYHAISWEPRDQNVPKSKKTKDKVKRGRKLKKIQTKVSLIEVYSKSHSLVCMEQNTGRSPPRASRGFMMCRRARCVAFSIIYIHITDDLSENAES